MERVASSHHEGVAQPRASVIVATCGRERFLAELVAALEAQTAVGFEVVIVDDGSRDGTWDRLVALAGTTALPLLALRIAGTGGPSVPRNTGVQHARAQVLLFTDDDCLPEREWIAAVLEAVDAGASFVRGPVRPREGAHGPWDRSIEVAGATPWFETSNICFRREVFMAAGGFPALRREFPGLRDSLLYGVFLNRRSAAFHLAVAGTTAALVVRRPVPLLATLPWLQRAWPDARRRGRGRAPLRLAQLAVADAVGAAALVQGSVRHRVPVL